MDKLKLIENILKAASTLVAALVSFVKFIGIQVRFMVQWHTVSGWRMASGFVRK